MKVVKATSWYIVLDDKMLSFDEHFKHISIWVRAKNVHQWGSVRKFKTRASAVTYAAAHLVHPIGAESFQKLQFRKLVTTCQY